MAAHTVHTLTAVNTRSVMPMPVKWPMPLGNSALGGPRALLLRLVEILEALRFPEEIHARVRSLILSTSYKLIIIGWIPCMTCPLLSLNVHVCHFILQSDAFKWVSALAECSASLPGTGRRLGALQQPPYGDLPASSLSSNNSTVNDVSTSDETHDLTLRQAAVEFIVSPAVGKGVDPNLTGILDGLIVTFQVCYCYSVLLVGR